MNCFECFADPFFFPSFPIAAQMLISIDRIWLVEGENIPNVSNTAEKNDILILWIIFARYFCSIPRQTLRTSVFKFHEFRAWRLLLFSFEIFHYFFILSVSGISVFRLHRQLWFISSVWIQFCWFLDFFRKFQLLLDGSVWLKEFVHVEVSLKRLDEAFFFDCIILRHLVQRVICTSRRAFQRKNVSSVLEDFCLLPWIFSPEKS